MFYNARWYDPSLGRFASADSIVPAGVQGYDRYAYVSNNPLRYVDPSGHKPCDGEGISGTCDQSGIPSTLGQARATLRSYDVKLNSKGSAKWTFNDAYAAYLGVSDIAYELSRISGQDSTTIFKQAFGPMNFTIRNDIAYFGIGWDGNVEFRMGFVSPRLTAHELGHSFERHMWVNAGNMYADNNPIVMLIQQGVYDINGNLITQGYNRYNGRSAPDNGYYCDSYIGECQYHSKDVDSYWNDPSEDFSDIFMNWTFNSFYPNNAGVALYNWVETNMASWLQ